MKTEPRLQSVIDELRQAADCFKHDAAEWYEKAKITTGYTSQKLLRDAIEKDVNAGQFEQWAKQLEAVRDGQ